MSILSICEHDRIHIGDACHATLPTITEATANALLDQLENRGVDAFKLVNRTTLSAQGFVGVIQVGDLTIEVLPKIDGLSNTGIRNNLILMLTTVFNLRISEGESAAVAEQPHGLLEALIRLFTRQLAGQVRRGLVREYTQHRDNLPVLRGKLDINAQIHLNAAHPERLYCRFDEFDEDNPLNRVLKAALRLIAKVTRNLDNRHQIDSLLLALDQVATWAPALAAETWVPVTRLNARYQPSLQLAQLFLRHLAPDVTAGRTRGLSLLFGMNDLFEAYIGRIAQRTLREVNTEVRLQGPERHLLEEIGKQQNRFFVLRPDIVMLTGKQTRWIIDTKWKTLSELDSKEGVTPGDIYQMLAYCVAYGYPQITLLYPHHGGLEGEHGLRTTYVVPEIHKMASGQHHCIQVATIDMRDLRQIPAQLKALRRRESAMTIAA